MPPAFDPPHENRPAFEILCYKIVMESENVCINNVMRAYEAELIIWESHHVVRRTYIATSFSSISGYRHIAGLSR